MAAATAVAACLSACLSARALTRGDKSPNPKRKRRVYFWSGDRHQRGSKRSSPSKHAHHHHTYSTHPHPHPRTPDTPTLRLTLTRALRPCRSTSRRSLPDITRHTYSGCPPSPSPSCACACACACPHSHSLSRPLCPGSPGRHLHATPTSVCLARRPPPSLLPYPTFHLHLHPLPYSPRCPSARPSAVSVCAVTPPLQPAQHAAQPPVQHNLDSHIAPAASLSSADPPQSHPDIYIATVAVALAPAKTPCGCLGADAAKPLN